MSRLCCIPGRRQSRSEASIIRWLGLLRFLPSRRPFARNLGLVLYQRAVAAARDPRFYHEPPAGLGVDDTIDGRFDMICLHVALLERRLAHDVSGAGLARAVFDAMFADMDQCLREAGVGDAGVPRRVRVMGEAFQGRARAYGRALDAAVSDHLSEALLRNVWRGQRDAWPEAERLAGWMIRQDAALATWSDAELASGAVGFLPPEDGPAAGGR